MISASGMCATGVLLAGQHGLLVETEQAAVGVVRLLQQVVGGAAVGRPELVLRVERRRVERLAATEPGDLLLDGAVVERLALPGGKVGAAPEADVHEGGVRVERVEV